MTSQTLFITLKQGQLSTDQLWSTWDLDLLGFINIIHNNNNLLNGQLAR